jgi:hypothetical protein
MQRKHPRDTADARYRTPRQHFSAAYCLCTPRGRRARQPRTRPAHRPRCATGRSSGCDTLRDGDHLYPSHRGDASCRGASSQHASRGGVMRASFSCATAATSLPGGPQHRIGCVSRALLRIARRYQHSEYLHDVQHVAACPKRRHVRWRVLRGSSPQCEVAQLAHQAMSRDSPQAQTAAIRCPTESARAWQNSRLYPIQDAVHQVSSLAMRTIRARRTRTKTRATRADQDARNARGPKRAQRAQTKARATRADQDARNARGPRRALRTRTKMRATSRTPQGQPQHAHPQQHKA